MSFLIDKGLEAAEWVSHIGQHRPTAAERAREARYADSAAKYKRIVLKWLYVDKVPIEQLERLGLWKPELLNVNLAAQGEGLVIPGVPLIPILTPGSDRPVSVVTKEKANEIDTIAERARSIETVIEQELKAEREQGQADREYAELLAEFSVASYTPNPNNYEGGPNGQAPTFIDTPEGVTGYYPDPMPSSSSSRSSSS